MKSFMAKDAKSLKNQAHLYSLKAEETAADEMRSAYKVGFKDGATMMQEIQD